jgi:hypothetical protein
VKVKIDGKLLLPGGSHRFVASGVAPGTYTENSFATVIQNGSLSGPGNANIWLSAASPVEGEIEVKLQVKPTSRRHPLGKKGYRGTFTAKLKLRPS